ncbi:MAG: Smr/MutS family protein [Candidatus Magasanikbacteria bacterium]|uniref:Smr domain-containing protein n=1 Tax=Candidatus Magasanikbacteria bacterium CG10_big_fil_rev_8_21_14_0_10_38_6 TaxID=1974647 RepID=A0A2M6P1Y7_9BACT|nr:Smr/MutS family protein [Candidatus Magasanikbacteria bacterium]NCS72379.1 Smr/MutS family protein [Candidatus Magasanikbacteria bacterium]PIR77698.1 MAG: hypothetical protein COU30_01015 [Candidatus Magasanikbacteria bacterium CG10_big_fil_rev_8_21_14_0_10_38_6]
MSLEEIFFAAQLDQHIHSIDLHEYATVPEALEQLERQLFFCYQKHISYCRVIHGIGEGILMTHVHGALAKNPMVQGSQCQGGSCIVVL